MNTPMPSFTVRHCPLCGSAAATPLLRLDCEAIFRSNWSYRADRKRLLSLGEQDLFPVNECGACRFIYAGLLPASAFLHAVYDSVIDTDAARRDNLSPLQVAAKMTSVATVLQLAPEHTGPLRVLDYGCGFGATLALLAAVTPAVKAVGYETSAGRIADLRARNLDASDDLERIASSGPFDAVILDNVLEHVPQPGQTIASIRAMCDPGALLFVSVPQVDRRRVLAQQVIADARGAVDMDINPWEHLNYFDVEHLDQVLAQSGFEPLATARLPGPVDIGLRASASFGERWKNGLASLSRLASYVLHGHVLPTTTRRFYRLTEGHA
jgi:SAM-dependent methyltransferase